MITRTTVGFCLTFSLSELQFLLSIPFIGSIGTKDSAGLFLVDNVFRIQFHEYTFTLLLRYSKSYRLEKDFNPLLFGELITEIRVLSEETIRNGDGTWVLEEREVIERYSRLKKPESKKTVYYFKVIPGCIGTNKHLRELSAPDALTAVSRYYGALKLFNTTFG